MLVSPRILGILSIEHWSIEGQSRRVAPRTRKPVEERRAELLELAISLFAARAYDEVSTEDVAREAGISKGLLYHYFEGKRGLYVESIREVARRLQDVTEPATDVSFNVALRGSLLAFAQFVDENRRLYAAMLRGGIGTDPQTVSILEDLRQVSVRRVFERLGVTDPNPTARVAVYGWVGFVETACLGWPGPASIPVPDFIDLLEAALVPALARLEPKANA
jgi:AcrR family transcriptional regulator